MRFNTHSLLVQEINHYKNRASLKYLTISAGLPTLPARAFALITGQKYEQRLTYPEILTTSYRDQFLDQVQKILHEPISEPMWSELEQTYAANLREFRDHVLENNARFVFLYVPAGEYHEMDPKIRRSRIAFENIVATQDLTVWDMWPVFDQYPPVDTTFMPIDGHLNAKGHQIASKFLLQELSRIPPQKTALAFSKRPKIIGDLDPLLHQKDQHREDIAVYEMKVNSQGLRLDHELQFPKSKPRMVIYGDSMTIGYYVDNHQTFGALLNQQQDDYEVVIAGKSGWTIADYLYSYQQRGQFIEGDVVVLTFDDSDLVDLIDPLRRIMSANPKQRRGSAISEVQRHLIEHVIAGLEKTEENPTPQHTSPRINTLASDTFRP